MCSQIEWEELEEEPNVDPDDVLLSVALNQVFYAINVCDSFSSVHRAWEEEAQASPGKRDPRIDLTTAQVAHIAAEREYLRWISDSDPEVAHIRRWISEPLDEEAMLAIIMNPITQVLSFEECAAVGLNSLMDGCLINKHQKLHLTWSAPEQYSQGESKQYIAAGSASSEIYRVLAETTPSVPAQEQQFSVEAQRHRSRLRWDYSVDVVPISNSEIAEVSSKKLLLRLTLPIKYRGESHLRLSLPIYYYAESLIGQLLRVCRRLIKDGFAENESAALRYLLMGRQEARIPFKVRASLPWFSGKPQALAGYYSMTIPPWALPSQVEECWRRNRPKGMRERCLPPPSSVELFQFVLAHTPSGGTPRWSHLATQWSRERGESITRDKLLRTFHSVRKAIALQIGASKQSEI